MNKIVNNRYIQNKFIQNKLIQNKLVEATQKYKKLDDLIAELKDNKPFKSYKKIVEKDGFAIKSVPDSMLPMHNNLLVKIAVRKYGYALKYVPDHLKTLEVCKIALENYGQAIKFIPDRFKTNDDYIELLKVAVTKNGELLKDIPENIINSELIECAFRNKINVEILKYVPLQFRTYDICIKAVNNNFGSLEFIPNFENTDYTVNLLKMALENDYLNSSNVSSNNKKFRIYKIILNKNGNMLEHILLDTMSIHMAFELGEIALKNAGSSLRFIPVHIRSIKLCSIAVNQDGLSLKYVPYQFKRYDICISACNQNGMALQYVPDFARTERMYRMAVENNNDALKYVPEHLLHLFTKKINMKTESKCLILMDDIEEGAEYYKCSNEKFSLLHIYNKNAFDEWVNMSDNKKCVYCMIPMDLNIVYINKEEP